MARSDDGYDKEEEGEEEEEVEDEEEEEEYFDDEEEADKRKKKKNKLSYFIDEEAIADDSDDEEEYEGDDQAEQGWSEDLINQETEKDRARRRELDFSLKLQGKSAEEIAKMYEEKARSYESYDMEEEESMEGLPKQAYWRLKCRVGEEKHFIAMMMQKFLNTQNSDTERVYLKSIMAPQHLPGHIYVEAERETHVKQAVKGMPGLLPNAPMLIPLQDIIEILSTSKKNIDIASGSWVRVKLGKYKGDIGKVLAFDSAKSTLKVKLIPRIDFSELGEENKKKEDDDMDGGKNENGENKPKKREAPKRKRTRPQAKPFNHDEIKRLDSNKIVTRGSKNTGFYYIFQNEKYIDGFLHKNLRLTSVLTDGVVPTLEELSRFQDRDDVKSRDRDRDSDDSDDEDENVQSLSSTKGILDSVLPSIAKRPMATFSKGDTVKVIEGDLKNLMGTVESVDEHSITILPLHEGIKDLLLFKDYELQKYFKIGDHVKVISGRYETETGLVLRVEDVTAVLLSDLTMSEIKVKIQDLQECSEISTGKLELGNYQLHDLVQTSGNRVGIIIKVERDSFKILDENSSVSTVKLQQVGNKRRTDATALDAYGNTINSNDMVEVADGLYKGKQGTVLKISRNFLFLKGKDVFDNSGVFVVRPNYTHLLGGSKNKQSSGTNSFGNYSQNNNFNSFNSPNQNSSQGSGGRGGGRGGGGGFRGGRGGGRGGKGGPDSPLHKIVTIKSGNWKGYTGIVIAAYDDMVQVELQTNSKKINLKFTDILYQSQRQTTSNYESDQQNLYLYSKTPAYGDNGMTPMHPSSGGGRGRDSSDPWSTRHSDTPHDNYSSTTPGTSYSSYSPYTPNTPSEIHRYGGSDNNYTPYDHRNMSTPNMSTPSIVNYDTPTPGSFSHNNFDQPTPHGDIPQSPYTPLNQPQTPSTPSDEPEDDSDQPFWKGTRIQVQFSDTAPYHQGKRAVVLDNTTESTCKVQLVDNNEILNNVSQDHLNLIEPAKKDRVMVVKGSYTGHVGTLFVLLGAIGIVKIDSNLDFKVFKMSQLGKLIE